MRDRLEAVLGSGYTITAALDGGGMSTTFVADEHALGRRIVIKVLPRELANAEAVDRFKREIAVVASVQHPLIVPLLTAGEVDGLPYFTMPFVDGESLRRRLTRGPLSIREATSVLIDVARALSFAHERGIVHRDIKPGNILLTSDSAVVADFGVAKATARATQRITREREHLTISGMSLGTPAYMAPEQASGDPDVDHRADLYALGVVAYEMLTGAPPFRDSSARRILAAHIAETPPPIAVRRQGIPPGLAKLVMQCLAKEPSARPRSAGDMVRTLQDPTVIDTGERFPPPRATLPIFDDLRIAARSLRRTPGTALCAILCLALGMGMSTAVYSALDRALFQPLGFRRPEELVTVYRRTPSFSGGPFSGPSYLEMTRSAHQLAALAAANPSTALLSTPTEAVPTRSMRVSGNFFVALGVPPLAGRLFVPNDDSGSVNPEVVLSEDLWRTRFGGDRSLIGKTIVLDGHQTVVIGVVPRWFALPHGAQTLSADVWVPLRLTHAELEHPSNFLDLFGRLAPGSTIPRASAELDRSYAGLVATYPSLQGESAYAVSLQTDSVSDAREPLLLMFAAVLMVLGVAITNVASLLLARGVRRQPQMAIRAALGATRWDMMRPALAESMVLAATGTVLGVIVAWLGIRAFGTVAAQRVPQVAGFGVGIRVMPFAALLAVVSGVIASLMPAWRATTIEPTDALSAGGRGGTSGRGHHAALGALVVAEVALSLVLLIGAGLTLKALTDLLQQQPGFDPKRVLTLEATVSPDRYPNNTAGRRFLEPAIAAVQHVPGVEAVGAIHLLPFRGWGWNFGIRYEGQPADPTTQPVTEYRVISPGFFAVTQQRLLRGRLPRDSDGVVVNQALARRDFAGGDPVGKRFYFGDTLTTIIGEVADIRNRGPLEPVAAEVYVTYRFKEASFGRFQTFPLMVRVTRGDPSQVASAVRAAMLSVDPSAAVSRVMPMEEVIANSVAVPRFVFWLIGFFAVVALVLSIAGIYGVMSYTVAQRTREIGIRAALGSAPLRTVHVVASRGVRLVGLGLGLGIVGSMALTRYMQSILYGVSPLDATTWGAATLALAIAGLLATIVPSARATRIDPVTAMRTE
ncbi:MAG TPA: ADOP family duplicated permease [Gemmatimonadaceae bacterium]|jgi:putative ABC transport system permease protein|nr:ADOP family duplicated permease [Gemmatimonadaceae bacterium]